MACFTILLAFILAASSQAQLVTHVSASFATGKDLLAVDVPVNVLSKTLLMTTSQARSSPSSTFYAAKLLNAGGANLRRRLTDFVIDSELLVSLQVWDLSLLPGMFGNVRIERGSATMSAGSTTLLISLSGCCLDPSRRFAVSTWFEDNGELQSQSMIATQFDAQMCGLAVLLTLVAM